MADDSIGFDVQNGVTEGNWAVLAPLLGTTVAVVNSFGSLKVSIGPTAMTIQVPAGGISIAAGHSWRLPTTTSKTIPPVDLVNGVRWDAIVVRRDWSTNTASIEVVPGTASTDAAMVAPTLLNDPGGKLDSLLALVKATYGSTSLDIRDRRVWAAKQLTVATKDALPPATTALYGTLAYVVEEKKPYRCLYDSSAVWTPESGGITELTGAQVVAAPASGWTVDGTHVNRCLVQPYGRQLDLEIRRSGAEINAADNDGNFVDTPIVNLTEACKPDRPIPVLISYRAPDDKEFAGLARLDPTSNGATLTLLAGAPLNNLAKQTAVGNVTLRLSLYFVRRTV